MGNASVRIERIDTVPTYNTAFDHLTKFYNRQTARPRLRDLDSNEIDLTGDSDDDVNENGNQKTDHASSSKEPDTIGLAAGLPGEFSHDRSLLTIAEAAVLALIEFPKQVVVALSVVVKYMKSNSESSSSRAIIDSSLWARKRFQAPLIVRQGESVV